MLAYFYLNYRANGLLPVIYAEGVPSLVDFLTTYLKLPLAGCYVETPTGPEFAGMGWLSSVTDVPEGYRIAECGIGMLPPFQTKESIAFGRLLLEYCFEDLKIDVLTGSVPHQNRRAIMYATHALGFGLLGPVDGQWRPVLTKTQWLKLKEKEEAVSAGRTMEEHQ